MDPKMQQAQASFPWSVFYHSRTFNNQKDYTRLDKLAITVNDKHTPFNSFWDTIEGNKKAKIKIKYFVDK